MEDTEGEVVEKAKEHCSVDELTNNCAEQVVGVHVDGVLIGKG